MLAPVQLAHWALRAIAVKVGSGLMTSISKPLPRLWAQRGDAAPGGKVNPWTTFGWRLPMHRDKSLTHPDKIALLKFWRAFPKNPAPSMDKGAFGSWGD